MLKRLGEDVAHGASVDCCFALLQRVMVVMVHVAFLARNPTGGEAFRYAADLSVPIWRTLDRACSAIHRALKHGERAIDSSGSSRRGLRALKGATNIITAMRACGSCYHLKPSWQ
jgi:hypothetical protein